MRLKRGMKWSPSHINHNVNGVSYRSVADFAQRNGVDPLRFEGYMRQNRLIDLSFALQGYKRDGYTGKLPMTKFSLRNVDMTYRGKWYDGLSDFCVEFGIDYATMYSGMRANNVKTLEEGVRIYQSRNKRTPNEARKTGESMFPHSSKAPKGSAGIKTMVLEYGDYAYESLADFCRYMDMESEYNNFVAYIKRHQCRTLEEAYKGFLASKELPRRTPVKYKGVEYPSVFAFSDETGIPLNTAYKYISKGLGQAELESEFERMLGRTKGPFEVEGVRYPGVLDVAKKYKIPYDYLYAAATRNGEEGVREAVTHREDSLYHLCGKSYSSAAELAVAYGLSPALVESRLKRGDSVERAVRPRGKAKSSSVSFGGVAYPSVQSFCELKGFTRTFIRTWSKALGFDDIEVAVNEASAFFAQFGGQRPRLINRMPMCIYEGVWAFSYEELGLLVNAPLGALIHRRGGLCVTDFLRKVKQSKVMKFHYEGKWLTIGELRVENEKYVARSPHEVLPRRWELEFPGCTYTETAHVVDIRERYEVLKRERNIM